MRIALGVIAAVAACERAIDQRLPGSRSRWAAVYLATSLLVWPITYVTARAWADSFVLALLLAAVAISVGTYVGRRVEQHPIRLSGERTPEWDWIMRHTLERDRLRTSPHDRPRNDGAP